MKPVQRLVGANGWNQVRIQYQWLVRRVEASCSRPCREPTSLSNTGDSDLALPLTLRASHIYARKTMLVSSGSRSL